jgi:hypothetical protein
MPPRLLQILTFAALLLFAGRDFAFGARLSSPVVYDLPLTRTQVGWLGGAANYSALQKTPPTFSFETKGGRGAGLYLSASGEVKGAFVFARRQVLLKPKTTYRVDLLASGLRQSSARRGQRFQATALPFKMGVTLANPLPRQDMSGYVRADLESGSPVGDFRTVRTLGPLTASANGAWQPVSLNNASDPAWFRTDSSGRGWLVAEFDAPTSATHTLFLTRLRYTFT